MSGSEVEPVAPEQAASQMQDATERLRDKAWMVAPMTSGITVVVPEETPAEADS
jgi:hypothetical protein